MARKKKEEEGPSKERWLVSYGDFITTLFATFAALYASSVLNKSKFEAVIQSFRSAFVSVPNIPSGQIIGQNEKGQLPPTEGGKSAAPIDLGGQPGGQKAELQELAKQIQKWVEREGLTERVRLRLEIRGLVISLGDAAFFDSGSADVRKDALGTLRALSEILAQTGRPLRVEGHTDDRPISGRYRSNWELSTARATTIVRYLIEEVKIPPGSLAASGYAEHHPMASNETVEGRARNRRIDIVILHRGAQAEEPK
jgi:chemotaxis protein MotB